MGKKGRRGLARQAGNAIALEGTRRGPASHTRLEGTPRAPAPVTLAVPLATSSGETYCSDGCRQGWARQ